MDIDGASPLAAFAGVRTLAGNGNTATVSREHRIVEQGPGVFRVVGGKLSSARAIGAEVVDRVCRHLGIRQVSRTTDELLVGAGIGSGLRNELRTGVAQVGLPETYADHLIGRYGTEATSVLDLVATRPRLATLLGPARVSAAEVVYAARHECVDSVADFALRRTGLAWSSPDHGLRWAGLSADELAAELHWSAERREQAVSGYRSELGAMSLSEP